MQGMLPCSNGACNNSHHTTAAGTHNCITTLHATHTLAHNTRHVDNNTHALYMCEKLCIMITISLYQFRMRRCLIRHALGASRVTTCSLKLDVYLTALKRKSGGE